MMAKIIRRFFAALILSASMTAVSAQGMDNRDQKADPPYKITTTGKKITIRSSRSIQHIMLWTADGNRVAEHKELNTTTYTLNLPVSQKTFFLMLAMNNGKIYTEKVAVP